MSSIPLAPPAGMRDLLPPEAAERARLVSRLLGCFQRWGYQRVTTPPFEHAQVIERGLAPLDRRDLLRFVDPSTGEVALLRPDITPQIARVVATQLGDRPSPHRLAYAATIVRQRRGRARRQRALAQAGVECIGLAGADADVEVIRLAAQAVSEVGLTEFRIELNLTGSAREALAHVTQAPLDEVREALGRKDTASLGKLLRNETSAVRERLQALVRLYGEPRQVLRDARKVLGADARLRELQRVIDRLQGALPIIVDLGEIRSAAYYTGVSFNLLAAGPGEAIGRGGRYDGLMKKFGAPATAAGFGLDLSNLEWALLTAGARDDSAREPRFVVAGGSAEARLKTARRLREAGLVAAVIPARGVASALEYARGWGYDAIILCKGPSGSGADVHRVADGTRCRLPRSTERLTTWATARGRIGRESK